MSYRTQNLLSIAALAAVLVTCGYDVLRFRTEAAVPGPHAQACCLLQTVE